MNFKLTKLKVIISIGILVVWYILLFITLSNVVCMCGDCLPENCPDVFTFSLFPEFSCSSDCPSPTTALDITREIFYVLFPGLLIYIIWSLFQKKEIDNKIRGKGKK